MNPGATTFPPASMTCFAGAPSSRPIAAMRPSLIADVAGIPGRAGAVDDAAAADQDVIVCGLGDGGGWKAEEREHAERQSHGPSAYRFASA